jgi:hypothetical protein
VTVDLAGHMIPQVALQPLTDIWSFYLEELIHLILLSHSPHSKGKMETSSNDRYFYSLERAARRGRYAPKQDLKPG